MADGVRFRTRIVQSGKNTTGIEVPPEVVEALGSGKRPKVKVTIGDYTYRSSLASMGGVPMVSLSAENRAGAGVAGGDEVEVELAVDLEERTVTVPPDLAAAIDAVPPPVPTSTACRTATRAGTSSRSRGRRQTRQGNGGSPSPSMPLPRAVPAELDAWHVSTSFSRRVPCDPPATGRPRPGVRSESAGIDLELAQHGARGPGAEIAASATVACGDGRKVPTGGRGLGGHIAGCRAVALSVSGWRTRHP